jgi:hypothetical protein
LKYPTSKFLIGENGGEVAMLVNRGEVRCEWLESDGNRSRRGFTGVASKTEETAYASSCRMSAMKKGWWKLWNSS